jgi:hypothetical protein
VRPSKGMVPFINEIEFATYKLLPIRFLFEFTIAIEFVLIILFIAVWLGERGILFIFLKSLAN